MKNFVVTRYKLRCHELRRRKGYTLIETIAAVAILGLLMVVLARVLMTKVSDQYAVDQQYAVLSADAFMADIYKDFHNCISREVEETPAGRTLLTFKLRNGGINIYAFDEGTGECTKNGVHQFEAVSFSVEGAGNNLVLYLKLDNERMLEMNVFK